MKTLKMYFAVFICFWSTGIIQGQENYVRQPVVAGSFYPGNAETLNTQLQMLFQEVEDKTVDENIIAIIVPHAGYVYSGKVAASAYAKLNPEKPFSHVFLIGTSHHIYLNGASIYNQGDYLTPLGKVPVDLKLSRSLTKENRLFKYVAGAHNQEHSIEVQLPFLQYHLKKPFKIVPIIIGTQSAKTCSEIAEILKPWFTSENLFIISSDFSHYPDYDHAIKNDRETSLAILSNSPSRFIHTIQSNEEKNIPGLVTSCCGWSSILTLLNITSNRQDIIVKNITYRNSGDSNYGDKSRVVGYHAITFSRKKKNNPEEEFSLTGEDKKMLLKIAREAIESNLESRPLPALPVDNFSDNLKTNCGAFVTLKINGRLRGCIGKFNPDQPLCKVVEQMARAAAFEDYRFLPLEKDELERIEIEISVLTPLKKIHSADEFIPGKQGIYIIQGNRSGTFLPQVAELTQWSREELLGHCAQDKVGIGWNGWKEAELYTYEALVFNEKEFLTPEK